MANRTYNQFGGTLERRVVKLFAKIVYNAGAPVLVTQEIINSASNPTTINPSQGIESLTVDGAGRFTLKLGSINGGTFQAIGSSTTLFTTTGTGVPSFDPYVRLLSATATEITTLADTATNALLMFTVVDDNVDGAVGDPSISFVTQPFNSGVPSAASLTDGAVLLIEITLSNTSAY